MPEKAKRIRKTKDRKKNHALVKERIMKAAAKIMNLKGYNDANISDIAREVGVKDPVIYQYVKGKEDLLFSVVEYYMEQFLFYLNEQIEGIEGAWDRLRKLIWVHLHFNDVNRQICLVLLECRSHPRFFNTTAFQMFRQYAGILRGILADGITQGIFRPDINLVLVRDIIFGLADFEIITSLVLNERQETASNHEDCMRLITRMIISEQKDRTPLTPQEKKHRIAIAGVETFAEKGYTAATISEIAKRAGIAAGTVYEYFKNKEDLLLYIPEDRFSEHLNQLKEVFTIKDPVRKFRRFVRHHFSLYLTDRKFLRIYLILILLNRRFYKSRAYYEGLREYIRVLEDIVKEGIDNGCFAPDTSIRAFKNMFLGAFTHMVIRWLFLSDDTTLDMVEEINQVADLLTNALTSVKSSKNINYRAYA